MASQATSLTRRQVAALLDISEVDVKARDGETLHPTKGPDGSWRYPPQEVAGILRGVVARGSDPEPVGAVCAAAFELFQSGKSLAEVVILLKQAPPLVRSLRAEYDAMAASLTISPTSVAFLEKTLRTTLREEAQLVEVAANLDRRLQAEYQAGLADATDLGKIVDPESGTIRPLSPSEISQVTRAADEQWGSSMGISSPARPR